MSGKASPASIAAMYQEALLAHHRAPHNRREMSDATSSAVFKNPVCGDEIRVFVRVDGGQLVDVSFTGRGCSVATASASMMTDALCGGSVSDALATADAIDRMLATGDADVALPATLSPLRGVTPFAGRHGCARMAWQALREALA
ncbi:MAG TPA: SUF system NifU family Fe-S cluster assembly protein [Gemmatimonas sp.]|uniref:Fe-S cluster assembly sulfur transfer protein SufU n=1 Tax=Gemmatimonas sp. TaxID=1962908 RepID=UPI002ED7A43C